ncbi:hypothetical protein IC582_029769 [Cucumis melo]
MYLNRRNDRCQSPRAANSLKTKLKSLSESLFLKISRHRAMLPRGGKLLSLLIRVSTS